MIDKTRETTKSEVLDYDHDKSIKELDELIEKEPSASLYAKRAAKICLYLIREKTTLDFVSEKNSKLSPPLDEYTYEDALKDIDIALQMDYKAEDLNIKALILKALQRYDEGIAVINKAIAIDSKAGYYATKADLLITLKRNGEALESIDKAIEVDKRAKYFFVKATLLNTLKRYVDALECYNEAINIEPETKCYHLKAYILNNLERYDEAVEFWDKAIVMEPDSIYYFYKAVTLRKLERYDEALQSIDKAIEMDAKAGLFAIKAGILKKLGRYDEALGCINIAIMIAPNPSNYKSKANILVQLKRYEEALDCINITIKIAPEPNNYLFKAVLLVQNQKYQEALDVVNEALLISDNLVLKSFKLFFLINTDKIDEAKRYFDIAEKSDLLEEFEHDDCWLHYLILYGCAHYCQRSSRKYSDNLFKLYCNITENHYKCSHSEEANEDILKLYEKWEMEKNLQNTLIDLQESIVSLPLAEEWLKDIDKRKVIEQLPLFLLVQLYCNIGESEKAKILYNEYIDDFDIKQSEYLQLLLAITEPIQDSLNPEQLKRVQSLDSTSKYDTDRLIDAAWESGKVRILIDYFEEYSPQLEKHKWYYFWVNVEEKRFKKAVEIIEGFSLDNLFKETAHSHKPSLDNNKDFFIPEISKIDTIGRMFERKLPYDKLDLDLFCKLLRKLLPGFSSERFNEILAEVMDEWVNEPENLEKFKQYGDEYRELSIKKELVERLSKGAFLGSSIYLSTLVKLLVGINDILSEKMHSIVTQARVDERNSVLSNLSHSIKNMLRAIINPLDNMRIEIPDKALLIDSALKGANLIREIVNSISLSFNTTLDDLIWDIKHLGKGKMSLQDMIKSGLDYSIANMFDFKYFNNYASNYYPASVSKEEYNKITGHWRRVASSNILNDLIDYANQYMFTLTIEADGVAEYYVGNEKSSAIKLMILFQEIIFNAVKYASYVPKKDRFIEVKVYLKGDKVHLQVKNSYSPRVLAKTTGVGKVIIENFAKVLNCTTEIHTEENTYTLDMEFEDLWRKNAEDIVR